MRLGWARASWVVPTVLYAVAVALRYALVETRPYGDEAHHYYIAREFGRPPVNLLSTGGDTRWLFWWRPMFSALLSPGAQVSFTGFRVGYILLVSTLAPAMWWWLRARGVRTAASAAAGLVLAAHPYFVLWGVRAFPDELMAAAFVAGLALWERQHHLRGAALLLVAIWVKEVALIGVLALAGLEGLRLVRDRHAEGPRVDRRHGALLAVLVLAWVPHWYATSIGGRSPGWSRGGELDLLVDAIFLTTWAVPLVVAALASWRGRLPALLALGYLAFYGYYTVRGGMTEHWYYVLPATLAVGAIAAGIDAWCERAAAWLPTARTARLVVQAVPIVLVAAVVAGQALLPAASPAKALLHPGVVAVEHSYTEMVDFEHARDQDLWTVLAQTNETDWDGPLAVDFPWFFPIWPLSDRATLVGSYYTNNGEPARNWAFVIEELATMTLVWRTGSPNNQAILDTYADCIDVTTPSLVLIHGKECKGRTDQLASAWTDP